MFLGSISRLLLAIRNSSVIPNLCNFRSFAEHKDFFVKDIVNVCRRVVDGEIEDATGADVLISL